MRRMSVASCVDRFVAWTAANRKAKTVDHYRYQLGRFVKEHGRRSLSSLSPALVTTWTTSRHAIQAVQRLCAWCYRWEKSVKVNPLFGMPKPRMGQRRRVLDRAEMVRLLRGSDRTFRPFLIVLRDTMARPQEVRALTWEDLVEDGRGGMVDQPSPSATSFFSLPTAKGFEFRAADPGERVIPISPRVARLLARLSRRPVTLDSPILRDSKGRAWTANAVRCRMRRLRERAGVVADRRGERAVLYSFRHTGATAAAVAGVGQYVLAGVLGHASPRTTERYVHPRPADLVAAMKRVYEVKRERTPKKRRPGSTETRSD